VQARLLVGWITEAELATEEVADEADGEAGAEQDA
jgi:hypothetical protein